MNKLAVVTSLVVCGLLLQGCPTSGRVHKPMIDPINLNADFGNSNIHNAAVHVVDPAPANAGAGAPDLDGDRSVLMLGRYKTDSVEETAAEATTDE